MEQPKHLCSLPGKPSARNQCKVTVRIDRMALLQEFADRLRVYLARWTFSLPCTWRAEVCSFLQYTCIYFVYNKYFTTRIQNAGEMGEPLEHTKVFTEHSIQVWRHQCNSEFLLWKTTTTTTNQGVTQNRPFGLPSEDYFWGLYRKLSMPHFQTCMSCQLIPTLIVTCFALERDCDRRKAVTTRLQFHVHCALDVS